MAIVVLEVESPTAGNVATDANGAWKMAKLFARELWRALSGQNTSSGLRVTTGAVRASGTLTLSGATGAVGGTIAGTLKTVTASGGDTATATALAAAINADATLQTLVEASSVAGVVTIKALAAGVQGNKLTLVASGTGCTASGATLANGAGSVTTYTK